MQLQMSFKIQTDSVIKYFTLNFFEYNLRKQILGPI